MANYKRRSVSERFWSKVDKRGPDECWPWLPSKTKKGYGKFSKSRNGWVLAHRQAYELAVGPVPQGDSVCHSCDNPPCCNPNHLWPGAATENTADMIAKRRDKFRFSYEPTRGELNINAKLSEQDVREIRAAYKDGALQKVLGWYYGVAQTVISKVVRQELWAHVT